MKIVLVQILKKLTFIRLCSVFISYVLLPLTFILWLLKFRILKIECVFSIGHFSLEPDCYLKECYLGQTTRYRTIILAPKKTNFFTRPNARCCNDFLAQLWKQHFYVVQSPLLSTLLFLMEFHKWFTINVLDYTHNYLHANKSFQLNRQFDGPALLSLDASIQAKGAEILLELGIPSNRKYIVFANRDSGYRNCSSYFSFRNNDINLYHLAIKDLVSKGYYCIRLGDKNSQPINWDLYKDLKGKVIDYSRSNYKSDWMDIFLIAHSAFFLVGSMGLNYVATLFQIPLLLVEQIPFCHFPHRYTDISIPKLYIDQKTNQFIPFKKILNSKTKYIIHDKEFEDNKIALRSPTEDEILWAVREMLQQIETNDFSKTFLQRKFDEIECETTYSFPPAAKISDHFLKKFSQLF